MVKDLIKYYFIVASTQFLVIEEPLEEVLRERIQFFRRKGRRIDFWLLPKPLFLEAEMFKKLKTDLPNDSLAIISTNKVFISWLKLRLQNVVIGTFSIEDIKNPLDFNIN
jgi:Protein of unknown function (DUF2488)